MSHTDGEDCGHSECDVRTPNRAAVCRRAGSARQTFRVPTIPKVGERKALRVRALAKRRPMTVRAPNMRHLQLQNFTFL